MDTDFYISKPVTSPEVYTIHKTTSIQKVDGYIFEVVHYSWGVSSHPDALWGYMRYIKNFHIPLLSNREREIENINLIILFKFNVCIAEAALVVCVPLLEGGGGSLINLLTNGGMISH